MLKQIQAKGSVTSRSPDFTSGEVTCHQLPDCKPLAFSTLSPRSWLGNATMRLTGGAKKSYPNRCIYRWWQSGLENQDLKRGFLV